MGQRKRQATNEPTATGTVTGTITEAAFAARWRAGGWRGQILRSESGETFTLIFQGRPGGPAGPDFRDAVLEQADGARLLGDIELHLRPAGWRDHGHTDDPRYNGLALHVTLRADPSHPATRHGASATTTETALASGRMVPLVILSHAHSANAGAAPDADAATDIAADTAHSPWPCADITTRLAPGEQRALLLRQGMARFERRVASYCEQLRALLADEDRAPTQSPLPTLTAPHPPPGASTWTPVDRLLFVEIAEALGYGRDRAALRALGERLATGAAYPQSVSPETLDPVERLRAEGLRTLRARWQATGPLATLPGAVNASNSAPDTSPDTSPDALLAALTVADGRHSAVSPGRAKIVAANVVLPFLSAWATERGDSALAERARACYMTLPSLPSNQITREMGRQLGLARLPAGAALHQGLHHLWAAHCREKQCAACPCNGAYAASVSENGATGG